MIKSITPQYMGGKNTINFKENSLTKTFDRDSSNGQHKVKLPQALYQKAQTEVINNKMRVNGAKPIVQTSNSNLSTLNVTKREETPKDLRGHQTHNFYGSPDMPGYGDNPARASNMSTLSSQHQISKKNSNKTINIISPNKKMEPKNMYQSYDLNHSSHQGHGSKKPGFTLDLKR
eukprot:CAMPEP_0114602456 /NCGR_PEP_ID=MMETSP0125-20121206/25027_1 /TAXON_ID=485358 ORGANISM="Aristerostoma sp., Strain ATCC 50986" /NCGR_SAMPLE_ID=MMETSP0125 /ASSEMBLY_ACC=CAM_ASM_000245 /LENGTH=174 /DNA_ID=CAMNT_0001812607 /DNA_START=704 /DNA_END=1228 /DNA_ORIENTATION=+